MKKAVSGAMLALLLINMLSLTFNIQPVKAEPDIITRYPWPMFHQNFRHTGYTESPAPRTNQIRWTYPTSGEVYSSPAVVDGRVYFGSDDGNVYCLDALTGGYIWSYPTSRGVYSSPAVVDAKVYVGCFDGLIYCLDASTGALIWRYITSGDVKSSPAIAYDRVYVGSGWGDGRIYCLDASNGSYLWACDDGYSVESSPAVADFKVYIGGGNPTGNVYCLDAFTGEHIWSYPTGAYVDSSPAVADGMVFVGSYDGTVYAFGNIIKVPEDYPTVQEAINNATSGATISIAPGIYHESVIVNKPLTILGRKGSAPTFEGGGSGIAFTLQAGASGTTIAGIVITNYAQAIFIDGASNCKIYDNIMTLNVNSGIAEGNNAANNLIYSNVFQQNIGAAISLTQYSASTTIYNNTIILNSIGLNIASSGNTIYWNIFIDNTKQVQIAASLSNNWDNGYPDGGNYWSGYTGVDEKSGPNQDLPGSDGIGDTHYTIDVPNNIIDRYPLMNPSGPHNIQGDFNGDFRVNYKDDRIFGWAYIAYGQTGEVDPRCDLNEDGKIDYLDDRIFGWAYIAYGRG